MAKSVELFCGTCGEDREFVRRHLTQTSQVRGEPITAGVPVAVCPVCGNIQPDPDPAADPTLPFYDEYRRRHHLLAPAEIRRIRKQYGMSPETFANLLGMSPATIYRYENGALQDEVHDALIFLCRHPKNMQAIVDQRKENISKLLQKRYKNALARHRAPRRVLKKPARAHS